jgi:hypothetical protein
MHKAPGSIPRKKKEFNEFCTEVKLNIVGKALNGFNIEDTFTCNMKCSWNHKTNLTFARDGNQGAREGQTCVISQGEVHTVCARPIEGSSHGQKARLIHIDRAADQVLSDLAGGVRNDGADLCGDAVRWKRWAKTHRSRGWGVEGEGYNVNFNIPIKLTSPHSYSGHIRLNYYL